LTLQSNKIIQSKKKDFTDIKTSVLCIFVTHFIGFGIVSEQLAFFGSGFLIPFIAFSYRMNVEEKALIEQFGEEYLEYRRKTKS
jgi:protein-S-isoprenylcysteine O-methyltransferase Ste14